MSRRTQRETLNAFNDPHSMNRKGKKRKKAPPSKASNAGNIIAGNLVAGSISFGGVRFWGASDCMVGEDGATIHERDLPHRKTTQPVIGWRAWRLGKDGHGDPVLLSAVWDTEWTGPVHRADHKPGIGDDFGVHAFRRTWMNTEYTDTVVEGEVLMFGKTIVFEKGIRSEAAMIRRLVVYPGGWGTGRARGRPNEWALHGERELYMERERGSIADNRVLLDALAKRYDCDVSFSRRVTQADFASPTRSALLCPKCESRLNECGHFGARQVTGNAVQLSGGNISGVHIRVPRGVEVELYGCALTDCRLEQI